jgi:aryl-alcohol dehydrogenase-like predicted oxidoreductase
LPGRRAPNVGGLSRKAILHEIDASLKRLGMDFVDLYQIHRWDPTRRSRRRWRRCTTW